MTLIAVIEIGNKGPILVKFVGITTRTLTTSKRKKLKGKSYFINESLTAPKAACLKSLNQLKKKKDGAYCLVGPQMKRFCMLNEKILKK